MKSKTFIPIIFLLLLSSACHSVSFISYRDESYPASSSIEVFRSKSIEKEYIELGELSLRVKNGLFGNQDEVVLKLKEKAKEIGADAIIILGEETEGNVIVPIGNLYNSIDKRYIKAIAIKYKN